MTAEKTTLKRSLSLSAMVFYGLGTIIGAGIYVLIGEIAGLAGAWMPLSFLIAALIASFTGLSYAELVGRYPRSAGEAVYVDAAFQQRWLTQLIGWSVVFTGLVSASTLLKGFSGYYTNLLGGDAALIICIAVCLMCLLAISGVKQSVGAAVFVTVLELSGLGLVVLASIEALSVEANWQRWEHSLADVSFSGVAAAAFLAFYAFIGFEDMVNMAEEVKDAERALPRAIIIAVLVSTFVYIVVAIVAVVAIPLSELATSPAPMAIIVSQSSWFPVVLLSLISVVAILNGAIVQLLMASRVIYGLCRQSPHLYFLASVNAKTKTPIIATLVVSVFIIVFSLSLPLARLAQITSAMILIIFILVNLSLIIIKKREKTLTFEVPYWVPVLGLLTSCLLFGFQFFIE
ncbi:MAG: APC family permease [Cellvibrionaceae bacterium]